MVTYYTVGGHVRDELLGIRSKDIDFAVEADSYQDMKDDILARGMQIFQERPEFFAIRARHPELGGVDFTLCRKDGFYSDNRHPDSVQIGTIYDDLARRDFTVNAIAKTEDGRYIDPHSGREDIRLNYLRCVGNADERIQEDPLRILRAMRFSIVLGFDLSTYLRSCIEVYSDLVQSVSIERVYEELKKCYDHDTWETMYFFKEFESLEYTIFHLMGLNLQPRIRE